MGMVVNRDKHEKDFTVIANAIFRDKTLSLRDVGLFVKVLSVNEKTWDFSIAGTAATCTDRKGSIRTALKNLEKKGYLVKRYNRSKKGQYDEITYNFIEVPNKSNFCTEKDTKKAKAIDTSKLLNRRCLAIAVNRLSSAKQ